MVTTEGPSKKDKNKNPLVSEVSKISAQMKNLDFIQPQLDDLRKTLHQQRRVLSLIHLTPEQRLLISTEYPEVLVDQSTDPTFGINYDYYDTGVNYGPGYDSTNAVYRGGFYGSRGPSRRGYNGSVGRGGSASFQGVSNQNSGYSYGNSGYSRGYSGHYDGRGGRGNNFSSRGTSLNHGSYAGGNSGALNLNAHAPPFTATTTTTTSTTPTVGSSTGNANGIQSGAAAPVNNPQGATSARGGRGGSNSNRGGRFGANGRNFRCQHCWDNDLFCTHCNRCGESGHIAINCTLN